MTFHHFDRRGKRLESKLNLTEVEQLQLNIKHKQLEERNRLLEIKLDLLKKVRRGQTGQLSVRLDKHLNVF